jgi:hypothetical protein
MTKMTARRNNESPTEKQDDDYWSEYWNIMIVFFQRWQRE